MHRLALQYFIAFYLASTSIALNFLFGKFINRIVAQLPRYELIEPLRLVPSESHDAAEYECISLEKVCWDPGMLLIGRSFALIVAFLAARVPRCV